MKSGNLVPDTLMLRLIHHELSTRGFLSRPRASPFLLSSTSMSDPLSATSFVDPYPPPTAPSPHSSSPAASFILDGFPRTAPQASRLDSTIDINLVVNITTPLPALLARIQTRWVHAPSGRTYNESFNPPRVPGLDDVTGEKLVRRDDDKVETYMERLKKFSEINGPLLKHYRQKGVLWDVEGETSDEITPKLVDEVLKRFG
jgi:adenylate kinase